MSLFVCVVAATLAVAPPELKNAEGLMAKYKYAEAQAQLKKARAAKGLDRASLLRILELQGIAAGQQRQAGPATQAFSELLTLDPGHKLAEEFAPRVMTPFFEAGQAVNEAGALELKAAAVSASNGRLTALNVEVPKDALKLVRSLVFHISINAPWSTRTVPLEGGKASTPVDATEVQWWAELLGENDAQLVVLGSESNPLVATPPAPMVSATAPPPLPPSAEPVVTKSASSGGAVRTASFFVMGGAVVAAGVGAFFGVRSSTALGSITGATRDDQGRITSLTEREAAARGAQAASDGLIANILFVSAGVVAAAGIVMFIVGGPETPARVTLAPALGGFALSGSFP
ncbi:MAG: hypothetical protein QM817_31815 [Archangium sp.]